MDVVANRFEIGTSTTGLTTAQNWIKAQIAAGYVNMPINVNHQDHDQNHLTIIMAKTLARTLDAPLGTNVLSAQFKFRNDVSFTALLTFLNNAVTAGAKYVRHIDVITRYGDEMVSIIVSN